MNDSNGSKINIGDRAVILASKSDLRGRIGTVRAITPSSGALRHKPGVRVTEGPDGDPNWSVWVAPGDIAIVEGVAK